jgi:ATP-dependent Lon protease
MIPLVENNYNLCELGPRNTGKSHIYKEISPNSILVSGGQTTVASLFYNMSTRKVGLVGLWDTVAFDEVAGITFKDKDGIQIMKDYMASGSFARGREEKAASASMVFVGNINQSVDVLLKTSHLFEPFPEAMSNDTAFFDRMHYYLPGWEYPNSGRNSLPICTGSSPTTWRSSSGRCASAPFQTHLTLQEQSRCFKSFFSRIKPIHGQIFAG